jgi:hypothetical protein
MIYPKRLQSLLLIAILLLVFYKAHAQKIDEKIYQHKIRLMDSLSFYKMKDYDTLYQISILGKMYGRDYRHDYYGWINKRDEESILFINTNGTESEIENKQIVKETPLPVSDATIEVFTKKDEQEFGIREFGENYLLSLWLYKKGQFDYSRQLLPKNDNSFSDSRLMDNFGIIYYDAMLSAFSNERNYPKAIAFGDHLSNYLFNSYQYQKEAIALARQLKNNTEDFKAFHIPDSLEWNALKQKLNRKDQILYLADRLRLLNCIQPGQPGGIGYEMYQSSISYSEMQKLGVSYWDYNAKYHVINPFSELLQMKLDLYEAKLLLPYLLTETYIASYSYFRDFFADRTLHKLSWVTHDLIFEITDKRFFTQRSFDSLTFDKKQIEVEKIKKWCDENAELSKEDLTINILKTTDQWIDFRKALETARREKYDSLLSVIVKRFNDFKDLYWPIHKDAIAKTMFDLGNEKYIGTVRKWSKDTTHIEVNLWSSLFLLKYDKDSYEQAMNELGSVLKQCDGTAYYPHAMDLLLSMNDKRALKLAEGILNKQQFQSLSNWDYYLNFIKKLLLLKSDYTVNFLCKKLTGPFTQDEIQQLNQNNGSMNLLVQSDSFVLAVDELKKSTPGYNTAGSVKMRLEYKKQLSKWFSTQYKLLKEGKPNELRLNVVRANEPVAFVDTPH